MAIVWCNWYSAWMYSPTLYKTEIYYSPERKSRRGQYCCHCCRCGNLSFVLLCKLSAHLSSVICLGSEFRTVAIKGCVYDRLFGESRKKY